MMRKLALTSVKKRWRDYLVLMMGLIIAISIFYMFQTLSLNTNFLEKNIPTVSMVAIVFQLGAFLLGMITIVYIFYANSFLLSMRRKEYGMYMMLGAKKKKISQMMAIETLFIGFIAMVTGVLTGMLLAKGMGGYLTRVIDLPSNTYEFFVPKAVLVTLIFFTVLFFLTTVVNISKLTKTKTIDLLYADHQSEKLNRKPVVTFVQILVSLVLIGIGYATMVHIAQLNIIGVFLAIITITPGTFLFFQGLLPTLVKWVKGNRSFSHKPIRIFTLSQLSFKASSLARVLGLVAMLLALSLGAVTVGVAFKGFSGDLLDRTAQDVVSYNPTKAIETTAQQLAVKNKTVYHSKTVGDTQYFEASNFKSAPLYIPETTEFDAKYMPYTAVKVNHLYQFGGKGKLNQRIVEGFRQLANPYQDRNVALKFKVVDEGSFNQLEAPVDKILTLQVKDYQADIDLFKKIDNLEKKRHHLDFEFNSSKYEMYQQVTALAAGFMFMGFFLGVAFLAMLASSLMFKILTGAYQDIKRYDMLHKIGVSQKLLVRSIQKEILVLFIAPAILGIVHVLVGLQMFKIFIPNPYQYIALPFVLYGVVYFLYYGLTVTLYKGIVLPKKN
ncbi:FtsX-like permease family protein [Vagococcus humatus]|uniref:ABC transporter permease n=1 Tax=Vagococcus humatus TaxID=1889241 RepID=A0A429Z7U5_9ENTE|nr:ABC transporter permease [Vagococcus humatus]RST89789.1 ABC transporter permease [Vagococcus humatus]